MRTRTRNLRVYTELDNSIQFGSQQAIKDDKHADAQGTLSSAEIDYSEVETPEKLERLVACTGFVDCYAIPDFKDKLYIGDEKEFIATSLCPKVNPADPDAIIEVRVTAWCALGYHETIGPEFLTNDRFESVHLNRRTYGRIHSSDLSAIDFDFWPFVHKFVPRMHRINPILNRRALMAAIRLGVAAYPLFRRQYAFDRMEMKIYWCLLTMGRIVG